MIETTIEYTDKGAYVKAIGDQRDNRTTYEIDSTTGQTDYATAPSGTVTDYTYDSTTKNLTGVTSGNASVTYGYDTASLGNRLKNIISNGQTYHFLYDKWSNLQSVKIGDNLVLTTNTYADANGNLMKSTYGNGHSIEYLYDKYDRIIGKKASSAANAEAAQTVSYIYNANGQLAKVSDLLNGDTTNYVYDLSGRVTEYYNSKK